MRLIDADALIEEVNKKKVVGRFNTIMLIDNAPTVPLPNFKKGYKQAIIDGKTNYSRPQGEWIHDGINVEGMDLYRCSICNRSIVTWSSRIDEYPYCHCGAKMKGGAE